MPLPTNSDMPWPPAAWAPVQADVTENAAWYSGDPLELASFYAGKAARDANSRRSITDRLRFWTGTEQDDPSKERLHLPVAADVAAVSADLLFSETPSLAIPEAHQETADSAAKATEDRLQQLVEEDGIVSTLLEAAEVASGLSGVYLRPVWDTELAGRPILTAVNADRAVPEFRHGILTAVTFWSEVLTEGALVWRHLERHEKGVILHGLYCGTKDKLGDRRKLTALTQTAHIAAEAIPLPSALADDICARYIPNVRPNRKHRGWPIGRADTAGAEGLMDALDLTWSSWIRDIRLGKLRVIVPQDFLVSGARGEGKRFDVDQEIFSPLDMDPKAAEKAGITPVEFKLRVEEHARTALELYQAVIRSSQYSPQSFGLHGDGSDQTATEVRARKDQSMTTTGKKQRYWEQAVSDIGLQLLVIDREIFGSGVEPFRPRLDFGDTAGASLTETATALAAIASAQAASIETRVRMLNPEWDQAEVQAEVARIKDETSVSVPDPTGGLFDQQGDQGQQGGQQQGDGGQGQGSAA